MKRYIYSILFFTGVIFLSNCSSPTGSVDPLVGIWEMTEMNSPNGTIYSDEDNNGIWILSENGTITLTEEFDGVTTSDNGTWSTTGNKLSIITGSGTVIYDYSISGTTLTISRTGTTDGVTWTIEIKFSKQ